MHFSKKKRIIMLGRQSEYRWLHNDPAMRLRVDICKNITHCCPRIAPHKCIRAAADDPIQTHVRCSTVVGQCFHSWDQTRSQDKQWHGPSVCVCACVTVGGTCNRTQHPQHTNIYSRINPYYPERLFDLCSLLCTHWPAEGFHEVNPESWVQLFRPLGWCKLMPGQICNMFK